MREKVEKESLPEAPAVSSSVLGASVGKQDLEIDAYKSVHATKLSLLAPQKYVYTNLKTAFPKVVSIHRDVNIL